ncbi:DUF397 domain-containing protein [Streptomyces sp. NPDC048290]|uniref:DUF397 domain-containing protein n=1 Tax=Streptomyces sp. NPDC048290 TaxID=3155811 RepID=UPI00343DBCE9
MIREPSLRWFKSSHSSSSEGDSCVEVALDWFKSSYSDSNNPNDCVEVATTLGTVHVRDSKNVDGPRLALGPAAWTEFLTLTATS